MKVIIAGGGIGGLAVAIALAMRGGKVRVFERAETLGEVGAGLQISPNAVRVLKALKVWPEIEGDLFRPQRIEMRSGRSGRSIFSIPLAAACEARWGEDYIHIHRADLHAALLRRLHAVAPGAIRPGRAVTGYDLIGPGGRGGVAALMEDGRPEEAEMLIGADGLHSAIRAQMIGDTAPRYSGAMAWRAVVDAEALGRHLPPPSACVWAAAGRHAVTTRLRGGSLVNFVGVVEREAPQPEGWSHEGAKAEAAADFADFVPVVRAIIDRAPAMMSWGLYHRDPLARWSDGPVALLGDAAHPMVPSLAQGAAMALEDAWILGDALGQDAAIPALQAYYARRIARTARVQAMSLANMKIFHGKRPWQTGISYAPMWLAGRLAPGLIHARQDWIYGYDPTKPDD